VTALSPDGRALQSCVAGGVVWDNHVWMPMRPGDWRFLPQLERIRAAGVDAVTLSIGYDGMTVEEIVRVSAHFRAWLADRPLDYRLIGSAADILAAKGEGRLAVCFDIEGMGALGGQLAMVRLFHDLGVRWMLIAYNRANLAGGGCLDEADGGLTALGRAAIAEMNRLGMLVCCSHAGVRTAMQAIEASEAPVIFSHSNARAVWDHPRNLPDHLIRACAARGGVIGLNGAGVLLGHNDARIETFLAHLDHVLDLVGEDHVGLGLDYPIDQGEMAGLLAAQPDAFPPSLFPRAAGEAFAFIPPWRLPTLAAALADRGWASARVAKLMGGNLMRVAAEAWGG
jgi:membrane dipeptidase